ncbi:hypothetical protein MKW94_028996 [Papaver nudicaule]|uniref:Uncharacterized protein n=1 Tax=Papaver nudicaule TaxID=74823 RepID=A0AA41VJH6_PAPNU|nr:hypothetical protein [Papaver nudicaule]MCL7042442.1 hypothetical protein [Papaver nudicaule]
MGFSYITDINCHLHSDIEVICSDSSLEEVTHSSSMPPSTLMVDNNGVGALLPGSTFSSRLVLYCVGDVFAYDDVILHK